MCSWPLCPHYKGQNGLPGYCNRTEVTVKVHLPKDSLPLLTLMRGGHSEPPDQWERTGALGNRSGSEIVHGNFLCFYFVFNLKMCSTVWFHLSWGTLVCSANPLVCSVVGLCNSGSEAHQSVHAHSPWPHREKQADVVCWGERGGPGEERPGRVQVPKAGGRVRKFFLIFFFFLSFFLFYDFFCLFIFCYTTKS